MGNGTRQDPLLVTTSPRFDDAIHQSVLWAFEAYGKHNLVFAVSLGQGASGYAPNLDCQDGIIAVGRLTSSVLLIDAEKAKRGWDNWIAYGDERGRGISALGGAWGMVMDPRGVNVQAIVQPFYTTDPAASMAPTNWGVALVPNLNPSGPLSELDVSVGTTAPGVMWSSTQPLSGFPTYQYTYQPGVDQNPRPPFEADPAHGGVNQYLWPGVVKKPALAGTTPTAGFPGKKQAVWTNANVKDASGTMRQTNLVVGVSSMSPLASASGNSLVVMDEPEPSKTAQVGVWPDPGQPGGKEESPFGKGVAYEIAHQVPQIDPLTGYCVVQVYNRSQGGSAWFIVDLNTPSSPKTLAKLDGEWTWGTMSDGAFYGVAARIKNQGELSKIEFIGGDKMQDDICRSDVGFEIDHPIKNTKFYITNMPNMPKIKAHVNITGIPVQQLSKLDVTWESKIHYLGQTGRIVDFNVQILKSNAVDYVIKMGNNIRGGNITITVSIIFKGQKISDHTNGVIIDGINHEHDEVVKELNGFPATNISWIESRYRQFDAHGMPIFGPPNGYGIMQLDNPAGSDESMWNWRQNIKECLALLDEKRNSAINYVKRMVKKYQDAPDFASKNMIDTVTGQSYLVLETIQEYNGGVYWRWNSKKHSCIASPKNNYVKKVLAAKPQ